MDQGHPLARLGKEHPFLAALAITMIALGAIHHAQIGLDVLTVLVKHVKHEFGALDTSFRRFVDECTDWDAAPSEDAHPSVDPPHFENASSSPPRFDDPTTTAASAGVPKTPTSGEPQAPAALEGGR